MKTKIVTWLGGGQECIHYEGQATRVTVDGEAGISIQQVQVIDGLLHIVVAPMRAEFDILHVGPIQSQPDWVFLLLARGPSSNLGERPIYDAATEKIVGRM